MLEIIKNLFRQKYDFTVHKADNIQRDANLVKKLVQRFAEGNINLHLGAYSTQEDVDVMRERVLKHDFLGPPHK